MENLQAVLFKFMIRRTKEMKDVNGKPLIPLPPKRFITKVLDLSEDERSNILTDYRDLWLSHWSNLRY